jgi:hypothetical protein
MLIVWNCKDEKIPPPPNAVQIYSVVNLWFMMFDGETSGEGGEENNEKLRFFFSSKNVLLAKEYSENHKNISES